MIHNSKTTAEQRLDTWGQPGIQTDKQSDNQTPVRQLDGQTDRQMVFVLITRKSCAHARRRHEGKIAEHVKRLSWRKIISEISFNH